MSKEEADFEAQIPPRMRALGYILDPDNRWVNARLWLHAPDPAELLRCDPDQLRAFHDPSTWLWDKELPPPPDLPPQITRAVRDMGMRWHFWAEAWEAPGGALLDAQDLNRLGEPGLRAAHARLQAWRAERPQRVTSAVIGMATMAVWALLGWTRGPELWVTGMALIAVVTFWLRPLRPPEDLWKASADPDRAANALRRGKEALGPEWAELAEGVSIATADGRTLALVQLGLALPRDHLLERFTPQGLTAILELVVLEQEDSSEEED